VIWPDLGVFVPKRIPIPTVGPPLFEHTFFFTRYKLAFKQFVASITPTLY